MADRRWTTREEIAEIWESLGDTERADMYREIDKLERPLGSRS